MMGDGLGTDETQGAINDWTQRAAAIGSHIPEGALVGWLLLMRFNSNQSITQERLATIFYSAALPPELLPRPRGAADAFRKATKELNEQEVYASRGKARILVREIAHGSAPQRHLTLESVEGDRFAYSSPAAILSFDPKAGRFDWDNYAGEGALYSHLYRVERRFEELRHEIDGDAIYRTIVHKLLLPTAPLSLNNGSYLVWSDYRGTIDSIKTICSGLNEDQEEEGWSTCTVIPVINTDEQRQGLSDSLLAAVNSEVSEAMGRIDRILEDPKRLIDSVATIELDNYRRIAAMVDAFRARFAGENTRIDTKLSMLEGYYEDLIAAVTTNKAAKAAAKATR